MCLENLPITVERVMSHFLRLGLAKFTVAWGTKHHSKISCLMSLHGTTALASNRCIATTFPVRRKETFDVTFVRESGEKVSAVGKVGDSLLDVIINNHLDFDGFGACEGTLACSTCHLIFKPEDFERLKENPSDEELDMLDLAYGLCETSRLGCQVYLTKELSGMEIKVPAGVNDARGTDT
ncbi:adrenodoxin-like protein 2, mitochondrial isoform X1 [Dermacentor andersoni]|uniref:adrenodoxin-like protein 2, mitochondrial isoform X1 n=1 Tax=Dermacentor andersoni TaxID=34620 RepID=UPI00215533F0|nr:adrenodoxin-like protein 2, mitochondrial isoform X1 [Dermacentor andersoni]